MSYRTFLSGVLALAILGAAGSAAAHHPNRLDRCQSVTFSGKIDQIDWTHPHVGLTIKGSDGTTYKAVWLSPRMLNLAGVEESTLKIGDQVTATAGKRAGDKPDRPMVLSALSRPTDGWKWSEPPQGC